MAKHRRSTRLAKMSTSVKRAVAPAMVGTVAVVTVGATTGSVAVTGVAAEPHVSAQQVALKAVITPGSATNWNADGISGFFGIMDSAWGQQFGQDVVIAPFRLVEFWEGPLNIYNALQDNTGERNLVLSSGRGAGNASWVISYLAGSDDPADQAMLQDTVWILDNNVDRPNGGYAARLPFFALVGVNPVPTPTDTGAQMIDVGYEYAWNSSVPLYVTNPAGLLNSIIAYAYRYRKQDRTALPAEAVEPCGGDKPSCKHYVIATDGTTVVSSEDVAGTTQYVTYKAAGLPMLQPLRDWGGEAGNTFADATEPALKVLVDASYQNNDPIGDPSVYTPMRLITPPDVILRAAKQLPGAIAEGIENVSGDGDESAADTLAADVPACGTGAAAPVKALSTLEPPTSPGSEPAITDALAPATESVSRPVTKPAGKPVEKSDAKSVVTPVSRPGLNFSPRKPGALPGAAGRGLEGAAGRGGPISQLVKSVFGPKQAPSDAPEASDPGAAGE